MSEYAAFAVKDINGAIFKAPGGCDTYAVVFQIRKRHFSVRRRYGVADFHFFVQHETITAGHVPKQCIVSRFLPKMVPRLFPEIKLSTDLFEDLAGGSQTEADDLLILGRCD